MDIETQVLQVLFPHMLLATTRPLLQEPTILRAQGSNQEEEGLC